MDLSSARSGTSPSLAGREEFQLRPQSALYIDLKTQVGPPPATLRWGFANMQVGSRSTERQSPDVTRLPTGV